MPAAPPMKVLVVTQMWPGPDDPDLGAFVAQVVHALRAQGHELEVVAIDRRDLGRAKYPRLVRDAVAAARHSRPDVVFAHMLFPAGAAGVAGAAAARVPLVVMAHGADVENAERSRALRAITLAVLGRSAEVIANSAWLAERLPGKAAARAHVIDCGVDLDAFDPDVVPAAAWPGEHPRLLCVGTLNARKGVVALADAFARLERGSLVFLGDGPQRAEVEGRPGVHVTGRVPHLEVPGWIAAADVVCQPSRREPFGQAALEGLAMGRPVVATTEGGPAGFVPPAAGVLVAPDDPDALLAALERAVALGPPPLAAARAAAAEHDVRRQAARMAEVLRAAVDRR